MALRPPLVLIHSESKFPSALRSEHGPIRSARELAEILREAPLAEATLERVDFEPSDSTAPEAPGA